MNRLGLIESLRQQITSLETPQDDEDSFEAGVRHGMMAQCELLIDEYEKDTEPEVNGHDLKYLVSELHRASSERLAVATEWGKQHPELPFRDSPDCNRVYNNVSRSEDSIRSIFNNLAMDAGMSIGELESLFSQY